MESGHIFLRFFKTLALADLLFVSFAFLGKLFGDGPEDGCLRLLSR